ncbi:E1B 19K [Squirrel monkey adenovirus]|nr:E1B 19K [Squirrel monkey adenovirus]
MDLLKFLEDFGNCRRVLLEASNRTGSWGRWLLSDQVVRTVHQVKRDYGSHFERLLQEENNQLLNNLELGNTRPLRSVLRELEFENTGRVIAGLAFLVYLLDRWDENTSLSPGYTLDCLALAIWKHALREGIMQGVTRLPRARVSAGLRQEMEERLTQVQRAIEERQREREQRELAVQLEEREEEGATMSTWRPSPREERDPAWNPRAGLDPEPEGPLEEELQQAARDPVL